MCGLTGFWETPCGEAPAVLEARVRSMAERLASRGPDDAGTFVDPPAGLALGHRRLSILDLSAEGRQPMHSPDGRWTIAYNGEVYNFAELRAELQALGALFRTGTDTEVVLQALVHWGVEAALGRFVGMFAFALWDARERTLVLARDRLGIKPLYWSRQPAGAGGEGLLCFGSELKALHAHPRFERAIDRDALASFLRFAYVPAPATIWSAARKLRPGTWLRFRSPTRFEEHVWYDPRQVAARGLRERRPIRREEALERLDAALREAVRARRVADVPLGAFLSGGVDSSTVVAVLQALSERPARTFTIGFQEEGYDEAEHARAVARHLGTEHHELVVTPAEALAVIPTLPEHWDEPFADSSQIPTLIVSRFAREHVTVSLSGDGGDELFGGYPRYFLTRRLDRSLRRLPAPLRRLLAAGLRATPASVWEGIARRSRLAREKGLQPGWAGHRVRRLAETLREAGGASLYRTMVSHWKEPERLVLGANDPAGLPGDVHAEEGLLEGASDLERMMLVDTLTYLPDDILCKVDRASMAFGLEARVPLLDHRLLELAWSLPLDVRMGPEPGKGLLRDLLARYVPRELFERPKMGFGVPIAAWLRGPLREWGEELLRPQRLAREGFLDPAPIRAAWDAHQSGHASLGYYLWDVLAFQAWHERWVGDAPPAVAAPAAPEATATVLEVSRAARPAAGAALPAGGAANAAGASPGRSEQSP